ncbi:hypothetical protein CSC17_4452 [Klebsiella oxytoca]|nr:hypothetical protein CSC17_4452 [Klebsiella oxytoca]
MGIVFICSLNKWLVNFAKSTFYFITHDQLSGTGFFLMACGRNANTINMEDLYADLRGLKP